MTTSASSISLMRSTASEIFSASRSACAGVIAVLPAIFVPLFIVPAVVPVCAPIAAPLFMSGDISGETVAPFAGAFVVAIGLLVMTGAAVAVVPLAVRAAQPLRTMPAMTMHSSAKIPFFTGFASSPLLCAGEGKSISVL